MPDPIDKRRRLADLIADKSWSEASVAAVTLADTFNDDAALQRQASGCLTQSGECERARRYAARAVELEPNHPEFALHLGAILNACGDYAAAVRELTKAVSLSSRTPETYLQLAFAAAQLGNDGFAADLAEFAARMVPQNEAFKLTAAHYLSQASRVEDAILTLRASPAGMAMTAAVLRTRSGFLGQLARFEDALKDIDGAILLEPMTAEFHLHRSSVLTQMQRWDDALAAALRAMELEPTSRTARRHAITILTQSGKIGEAVRHSGALLAMAPDEPEFLSCMAHLLDASSLRDVARDFDDIAALKRLAPPRKLRPTPSFGDRFRIQSRSIFALVLRDIRSRYGDSRFGFFWTVMEPLVHVGFLALVFEFTMHGRPPLGTNFFFFYFTGVMPYLLMTHLTTDLGNVIRGNRPLLQIAQVTPFDLIVSKAIVDIFTSLIVYLTFSGLFALAGIDPIPASAPLVAEAFALSALLGFGTGMICSGLFEFGPAGESAVSVLLRVLYFASGIFYVPANMPVFARNILLYNPFLHIIDAMRMGFFADYDPSWNDPGYAAIFAVSTLAFGMLTLSAMSRQMRSIH